MASRSYLSIGDVLTLLRREFPDITISKIRFLESQGLVNPERTPSGYRKFYDHDVERLRWVLVQQREHFLPLRVIKDRLDGAADGSLPPEEAPADRAVVTGEDGAGMEHDAGVPAASQPAVIVGVGARTGIGREEAGFPNAIADPAPMVAVEEDRQAWSREAVVRIEGRPVRSAERSRSGERARGETGGEPAEPSGGGERRTPENRPPGERRRGPGVPDDEGGRQGRPATMPPESSAVARRAVQPPAEQLAPAPPAPPAPPPAERFPAAGVGVGPLWVEAGEGGGYTHEELAAASGLTPEHVADLRSHGLIAPEVIGGSEIYDADALSVARLASRFAAFGVEARHLRLYKNAAEREAGFVEQVILPFVRQRNPEARAQARQTSADLLRLGRELREVLVDRALRDLLRRR